MAKRNGNLAVKLQPVVNKNSILEIAERQRKIRSLKKALEKAETELKPIEQEVIEALESGAILEPGSPLASVRTDERRNVPWRAKFEEWNGKEAAEKIIANTEPTITKKLVIAVES